MFFIVHFHHTQLVGKIYSVHIQLFKCVEKVVSNILRLVDFAVWLENTGTILMEKYFFAGFSAFNFVCVWFVLDGTNGSSTSTSSASQGGAFNPPNIVMGAFSMPVDVVGATQVCD